MFGMFAQAPTPVGDETRGSKENKETGIVVSGTSMELPRSRLRVLSMDFDGCLYPHPKKYSEKYSGDVIKANVHLLNKFLEEQSTYSVATKIFSGSARQSWSSECLNAVRYGKPRALVGYSVLDITHITRYLNDTHESINPGHNDAPIQPFIHDPFLLADIFGKKEPGLSFQLALKEIEKLRAGQYPDDDGDIHSMGGPDDSKIFLLYAQMHKVANDHPDMLIDFDFFDDRGMKALKDSDDILEYLYQFYKEKPWMIPENITLRLNQYRNSELSTQQYIVQGSGQIDKNYNCTLLEMSAMFTQSDRELKDLTLSGVSRAAHLITNHVDLSKLTTLCPDDHAIAETSSLANVGQALRP